MADHHPDVVGIGSPALADEPAGIDLRTVGVDVGGQASAAWSEGGYRRRIGWRWLVEHRRPFL